MKKHILNGLLATLSLSSSLCFAGDKVFDVKYTQEQFKKDPTFNCTTDAEGGFFSYPSATIQSDPELNIKGATREGVIDTISIYASNLDKYYFQAMGMPKNEAHVTVKVSGSKVNDQTQLTCNFGMGGKRRYS